MLRFRLTDGTENLHSEEADFEKTSAGMCAPGTTIDTSLVSRRFVHMCRLGGIFQLELRLL